MRWHSPAVIGSQLARSVLRGLRGHVMSTHVRNLMNVACKVNELWVGQEKSTNEVAVHVVVQNKEVM